MFWDSIIHRGYVSWRDRKLSKSNRIGDRKDLLTLKSNLNVEIYGFAKKLKIYFYPNIVCLLMKTFKHFLEWQKIFCFRCHWTCWNFRSIKKEEKQFWKLKKIADWYNYVDWLWLIHLFHFDLQIYHNYTFDWFSKYHLHSVCFFHRFCPNYLDREFQSCSSRSLNMLFCECARAIHSHIPFQNLIIRHCLLSF